jgi:hypothetical protein
MHAGPQNNLPDRFEAQARDLACPIVLLARGGSGSRLLSLLALDAGVFLGNELNISGDSLEMVPAIYQGVVDKYGGNPMGASEQIASRLRVAAAEMLAKRESDGPWGFKLPEALLLLPEIQLAFPDAHYIHMMRDPVSTCLRRTHMTARLDNHIGQVTLPLAYDWVGRPRGMIRQDSPA